MVKLTTEDFRKKLEDRFGDQFDILSEYVNNETKIHLHCNHCGHDIWKRPSKMVTSTSEGCYICSGKNWFKTTESFKEEVEEKFPGEYKIIGEYHKAREPLEVQRVECGHVYMISPDNLLRGKGCPRCSLKQSSYMDLVEEYLDSHGIIYEKEKRFDDCRNIRPLPFDYYIPAQNTCIEVDGQFHFDINNLYKTGQSSFEEVSKRDAIKTKYCEERGIRLLRLPYYLKSSFFDILDCELYANTEITTAK